MKVAIVFSTKDRPKLTRQSIEPLLVGARRGDFDLFWIDGSTRPENEQLALDLAGSDATVIHNVRGGADAAIVFGLSHALYHEKLYDYVGLVENDVLLHRDWFVPTMELFRRGHSEGLDVGAVSARSYEDRILIQRDGYAICHNLGAGMIVLNRDAAFKVLNTFRTGWTMENRRIFMKLCGLDIGRWWAFRGGQHWITADWHFEAALASYGKVALALTPALCEMIGQVPPLAEQGLKLVDQPVELLRNDRAFELLQANMRHSAFYDPAPRHRADDGSQTIFPHQLAGLDGTLSENGWRLKWTQGYGPFSYVADAEGASITVPVAGPCAVMVSGGKSGAQVEVRDEESGYVVIPELLPEGTDQQVMQLVVPGVVTYRKIVLTVRKPGAIFYGLRVQEEQPTFYSKFKHSVLPPV